MSGFLSPPTFNPPQAPIAIGANGQVLTVVGGKPQFAAAASGGTAGAFINFAPPAGIIDPTIVGFTSNTGRIKVTLAGDTTFEGLPAGTDGQQLYITVVAGNFTLTLAHLNGATAQAEIRASADRPYALNDTAYLFYDGGLGQWVAVA